MALRLQHAIARNALIKAGLSLVAAVLVVSVVRGVPSSPLRIGVLLAVAVVAAVGAARKTAAAIRDKVVAAIPPATSYVRIPFRGPVGGHAIDWKAFDEHAALLAAHGFRHVGDYTVRPIAAGMTGVCAIFTDAAAERLVEVQYLHLQNDPNGIGGMHFSIASLVGGRMRVSTTDHTVRVGNYLIVGPLDVVTSHPGASLATLLAQHAKVVARVCRRASLGVTAGLTLERYVLLQREAARAARERLGKMSGFALAALVDRFEAAPLSQLAPAKSMMPGLTARSIEKIDAAADASLPPPVIDDDATPRPAEAMAAAG